MKIILFGATGMIGEGVLLEALDDSAITKVITIVRRPTGRNHDKLLEVVHDDFEDFGPIADHLDGLDACFWCLGTSAAGMDEETYTRITHGFTISAAEAMYQRSPNLVFCFVSGQGTVAEGQSGAMWARVKGKAENSLSQMGFREVIHFRPGFIRPMRGVKPRIKLYRALYLVFAPVGPIFRALGSATSTIEVGRAMIAAAKGKATKKILDNRAINELAAG